MHDLQQLVLARLIDLGDESGPLSIRAAAERSRGAVSHENLRKIARGTHSGRLNDRTAEGLAIALDLPIAEVYRAAKVPRPHTRWLWPERFDRLDAAERRVVEEVAATILEAREKGLRDAT